MLKGIFAFLLIVTPVAIPLIIFSSDTGVKTNKYSLGLDSEVPVIEFSQFKKFYILNPERWTLEYDSVYCRDEDYVNLDKPYITKKIYRFQFKRKDCRKYHRFYKNEKRRIMQEKVTLSSQYNKEDYIEFLTLMQEDIESLKKTSSEEFNQVIEIQEKGMNKETKPFKKYSSFCPQCNNLLIEKSGVQSCLVCGYSCVPTTSWR